MKINTRDYELSHGNSSRKQLNSAAFPPRDSFVSDFRSQRGSNFSNVSDLHFNGLALIERQSQFQSSAGCELLSDRQDYEDEEMTKDIDEVDSYVSPRIDQFGPLSYTTTIN